jgi:hypothetical protein
MLPHPGKERSARRAALPGGMGLRRNFFKPGDWDNFRLVALQRTASSTGRRYRQNELCAMHIP